MGLLLTFLESVSERATFEKAKQQLTVLTDKASEDAIIHEADTTADDSAIVVVAKKPSEPEGEEEPQQQQVSEQTPTAEVAYDIMLGVMAIRPVWVARGVCMAGRSPWI